MPDGDAWRGRPVAGALLMLVLALNACGFRPVHGGATAQRGSFSDELAAIQVSGLEGRLGQQVGGFLQSELNPLGQSPPARYNLIVSLNQETNTLAIQPDRTVTRFNFRLKAGFILSRKGDGEVLLRSSVSSVSGYDVGAEPFAILIAERDAERRAAREVSRGIRELLSVRFTREADPV